MEIIPVLDVAHGKVVRATEGKRESYAPIKTPLSRTAEPDDVARGLRKLAPFRKFYVADLDGIEGRGRNVHLVPTLSQVLPGCDLWIDAGTTSRGACRALLAAPVATLVVGSEGLETSASWREIAGEAPARTVLSLDFMGEEFMGPADLLAKSEHWPSRVIVMTLARVGGASGPDMGRIADIVRRAEGRRVYAAGGIRDRHDLDQVCTLGVTGALVASSLHSGKLTAGDLKEIAGR